MNNKEKKNTRNLLDVARRFSVKDKKLELSKAEQAEQDEMRKQAQTMNASINFGSFVMDTRAMMNPKTIIPIERVETKSDETTDTFLQKITFYSNMKNSFKAPYYDENSCEWHQVGSGITANTDTITSKQLEPHRLCTTIELSKNILNQTTDFDAEVQDIVIRAIYNKLVGTMLSDDAETDDKPKGVFNGISATTLTMGSDSLISDLTDLQYSGDTSKMQCVWIISPKARQAILKANPLAFSNGKFLDSEYIFEPRMEDGLIAYLPLDLFVCAQWALMTITTDAITKAVEGKTIINIEAYFDFDFMDSEKIQLAEIGEAED